MTTDAPRSPDPEQCPVCEHSVLNFDDAAQSYSCGNCGWNEIQDGVKRK